MRSIRVLLAVAVIASGVVPAAAELPDLSTRAGEDWGAFLGPTGNGRSAGTGIATPWPAAGPRAAPVIHGDRVLTFGPEGRLECRSLADGSSLWSVDTTAEYHVVQNFFGVGAAPLVVRVGSDELFSAIAASPVAVGDDVLLAECYGPGSVLLDLADGDPRVVRRDRNPRPRSALMAHWATPIVHDGHVYGSSGRHAGDALAVCVAWKTGAVQWSEPGLGRASMVLVDGHLVILGEFGELVLAQAVPDRFQEVSRARLVAADSTPLLAPPCWAAPVVARGLLFVRGAGRLVCVDLMAQ